MSYYVTQDAIFLTMNFEVIGVYLFRTMKEYSYSYSGVSHFKILPSLNGQWT